MTIQSMGQELLNNGFDIVPVIEGEKRPVDTGWTDKDYSDQWMHQHKDNGYAHCNIGIKSANTPGMDIDTTDKDIQTQILNKALDVGAYDVRWGQRPLVPFRSLEPMRKISSKKYIDEDGTAHQLEILGMGQQWVIDGKHPSGISYHMEEPIRPWDELPILTPELAREFIDFFEGLCQGKKGWVVKGRGKGQGRGGIFNKNTEEKLPLNKADWQVDELIAECGFDVNDYDNWIDMGRILNHQYQGSVVGFDKWSDWSTDGKLYDESEMLRRWRSYDPKTSELTLRTLIFSGKELVKEQSVDLFTQIKGAIEAVEDSDLILTDILPAYSDKFDDLTKEKTAQFAKGVYKSKSGFALGIRYFREALVDAEQEVKNIDWIENWYFVRDDGIFFNMDNRSTNSVTAFNIAMPRADGEPGSEIVRDIPERIVDSVMFAPRLADTFTFQGRSFVNSYVLHEVDKSLNNPKGLELFIAHCEFIIPDERDRALFLSFIAYLIQHKGKKITWAPILQGPPGNGKTYFQEVLMGILGTNNVKPVSTASVSSTFNDWAEGAQLAILNEIKIKGNNRHETLNTIKPAITDSSIDIHPKGGKNKRVINTQNYIVTTNFVDAIPMDEGDRRFLCMVTNADIQSAEYFDELFKYSVEGIACIEQYLMKYSFHEDFNPMARAPINATREIIIDVCRDDLEDLILSLESENENIFLNKDYISVAQLCLEYYADTGTKLNANRASAKLKDLDFRKKGRAKVKGNRHTFWSRDALITIEDIKYIINNEG